MAIKTFSDLIKKVGSTTKLAAALDRTQYAVDRWRSQGIPPEHWAAIMDIYGVSLQELHDISEICRKDYKSGKISYHGTKK